MLYDKYGVTNVSQISEIQNKKKKTWIDKYGVDNPSKSQDIIDKIKSKWPTISQKRKKTWLDKYGVDSYAKTSEFLDRRKATWLDKYGVDNPSKNQNVLNKILVANSKSEYKSKQMTLPSGKIIRYQGNEDKVIIDLIKAGIKENDIVTGPGNVPQIKYMFNGKIHTYYPDIYIPRLNQIIEVKSLYTWKKYKQKNLAKIKACKDEGYNINISIR